MTVHANESVNVVTHKPIEFNKTCMGAILKALPIIMKENRRNKVLTVIKNTQNEGVQKRRLLLIKLLYSCDLHFNVSSESNVLHSERC